MKEKVRSRPAGKARFLELWPVRSSQIQYVAPAARFLLLRQAAEHGHKGALLSFWMIPFEGDADPPVAVAFDEQVETVLPGEKVRRVIVDSQPLLEQGIDVIQCGWAAQEYALRLKHAVFVGAKEDALLFGVADGFLTANFFHFFQLLGLD